MGQEELDKVTGYTVFIKNRNQDGGRLLRKVCEELGKVTADIQRERITLDAQQIYTDDGKIQVLNLQTYSISRSR